MSAIDLLIWAGVLCLVVVMVAATGIEVVKMWNRRNK